MWRRVLVLWSSSRVAIVVLGWLMTTQLGWHRSLEPWQRQPWTALTGWDSVYYIRIAQDGYLHGPRVAFFPLYPATIAILGRIFFGHYLLAGIVISIAAGLAAGTLVGVVNGLGVTLGHVPPFIMTLGTMVMGRGVALIIADGGTVNMGAAADGFFWLGGGFLYGVPVPIW